MSHSNVVVEKRGAVVKLTLCRPEKANALNTSTVAELLDTLTRVEQDESARILIFAGAGRNFCAGADLAELLGGGSDGVRKFLTMVRELLMRLERSQLISIAAVHGAARAGGLELGLACDVILAARSSTFGDAHAANGLIPGGGSTARLPRAIGWQRAKWLILSGAPINASTALEWGLVFDVVDDRDLENRAGTLASSFLGVDSEVIRRAKGLLAMVSEQPLSASLDAEITALQAHYSSAAFQAGIARFLHRRK
jgi:enoyl-CoA hydratase/carnithine racemase